MNRIGEQIAGMRTKKAMTRKQLGRAVGVNEKYIEDIELGRRAANDELIKKISKVLEQDISSLMIYEAGMDNKVVKTEVKTAAKIKPEVKEVWSDAFESVLKAVPVYNYDLEKAVSVRQLPVQSNKVEGFPKEKVLYLKIQDEDMTGFRMVKGDLAFGYMTHEIENNTLCLVEYGGKRAVRQVKKLDTGKILLISNQHSLVAETVSEKEIKILARFTKLEIAL